ncbi:MAG TPA: toll/interleukin-1 receptor domain-containing protein, partial [Ktedonobacterales bacterium]|nr:toll/interleukin-1 receptor domain-containing protein [Ktedonobacterales bacterium]
MNETPRVFVCHAHADKALCTPYVEALRMLGLDLYYNPDDPQFGYLSSTVQDELRARKIMLALLTQDAIDSLWVKREMKTFVDLMKDDHSRELLLVPITPCSVQTGNQSRVTLIDASEISFDAAIDTIAAALGRPILTTGTPRSVREASRRISRRALIGGGALAAIAIVGGGTGWLLT